MRLDYAWDTTATDWLIRVYLATGAPKDVWFDSTYTVEAYVFGDGSKNGFRFAVDDRVPETSATNHEVSPWFIIDWIGWRLVSWRPSVDGVGSWLGDGSLDGQLRFDSIQLRHTPGDGAQGILYLDDLRIAKASVSPVATEDEVVPDGMDLYQNYPNPFTTTTHVRFHIPVAVDVSFKVYSVTGMEVATLLDGNRLPSGIHEVVWDASKQNLPSGAYFGRMEAGGTSRIIRMILVR
jgi:hypothetical protein